MEKEEYVQQVANEMLKLPENKVIEIVDFVHFLMKQIKNHETPLDQTELTKKEAFGLRNRLSTFEEDWNAEGMDAYDDL